MKKSLIRRLNHIPVYIEEDHHEVLPHIFKHIGAKNLPLEQNTLIHFDSHPDMLIPENLIPSEAFDKYKLFQKLSIENWILPSVYIGLVKTIVWVCPWWCHQIKPGEYDFEIGRNIVTDKLSVTCLESYYISEGLFTTRENLENLRDVKLIVLQLEENDESIRRFFDKIIDIKQQVEEVGHFILDFDLDFFSTLNPFVSLYSEAGVYQKLKSLYSIPSVPHNLETSSKIKLALKSTEDRVVMLENLKLIFTHLARDGDLHMYEGPGEELVGPVSDIVVSIRKHYPRSEIDWKLIHDAGCTFDDSELPHHISSKSEIQSLFRMTERILDMLDLSPTVITISRSSCDDYCPPHQVEDIQAGLLSLLHVKYENLKENHCYRD